jgi:hypothetical protein
VLASREGKDVEVLNRLGVPADAILAVERDPEAFRACEEKLRGKARFELGDVLDVVVKLGVKPSVSYLDFCDCNVESQALALAIAERTTKTLGVVFLMGRETPGDAIELCKLEDYANATYDWVVKGQADLESLNGRLRRVLRRKHAAELAASIAAKHHNGYFAGLHLRGEYVWYSPYQAYAEARDGSLPNVEELRSAANNAEELASICALHSRVSGFSNALSFYSRTRTVPRFSNPSSAISYVGHRSPMCSLSYDLVPLSEGKVKETAWMVIPKKNSQILYEEWIRDAAVHGELEERRFLTALGISKASVAAYKANRTRKTG